MPPAAPASTDLKLPAGEHILNVYPSSSVSMPYSLVASVGDLGTADPEPNSAVAQAVALDPAKPVVRGRLAAGDSHDWYSLVVDDTLGASLADIRLVWRDGPTRQLCLADAAGNTLQCRTGEKGVSLSGLRLPPGVVTLDVSGDPSADSTYLLRIDTTTAPAADFETEPNDDARTASVVVDQAIRGVFTEQDYDFYRVTTTGEPQLWQVDATGSGISALRWVQADGTELGTGDITDGHALLTDLYLIPGNHWLRVDGSNGEYSLALTALGPPDPNSEREPNDQALNAEPFAAGQTRTGRLPTDQRCRRVPDHRGLRGPPPLLGDAPRRRGGADAHRWRRRSESATSAVSWTPRPCTRPYCNRVITKISLWSRTDPSTGRYTLGVERLDPFLVAADREPNNTMGTAAPLPPSLHVDGTTPESGDLDWYAIPVLPAGGDLGVRTEGVVDGVVVSDGVTDYVGGADDGMAWVVPGLPSGVPLWLRIGARGPYTFDVDPGTTGLTPPTPDPAARPGRPEPRPC